MNALESPIEAQAFYYLTYSFLTAVSSVWTWIAALTAAVSFWRIRFPSPHYSRIQIRASTSSDSSPPLLITNAAQILNSGELTENVPSGAETPSSCVVEREGSTKVKFSLYYEDCEIDSADFSCEDEDSGHEDDDVNEVRLCGDLKRTMEIRAGDLGLYRFQDLTVLDGNVVRLWEGERPIYSAPSFVYGGAAAMWY